MIRKRRMPVRVNKNTYATQIDDNITVNVVDPRFEESEHEGLKNYLTGFVKEGAGAGGAMFTALVLGSSVEKLRKRIEKVCK